MKYTNFHNVSEICLEHSGANQSHGVPSSDQLRFSYPAVLSGASTAVFNGDQAKLGLSTLA